MTKQESGGARRDRILKALGAYQRQGAILTDTAAIGKMLGRESDRGTVIIIVSFLEDALVDRVMEKTGIPAEHRRDLTRSGAIFSSFTPLINLAVTMGIIHSSHGEMLETMKTMRNACAHSRHDISFATPELRDTFSLLFADADIALNYIAVENTRDLFIFIAGSLLTAIKGQDPSRLDTHIMQAADIVRAMKSELPTSSGKPKTRSPNH